MDKEAYWKLERLNVVQKLALASKKAQGVPPKDAANQILFTKLDIFLAHLEGEEITPELKSKTKIDQGLQLIFDNPNFFFPEEYKYRARALYEKWEHMRWGAPPTPAQTNDAAEVVSNDESNDVPTKPSKARRDFSGPGLIRAPPADHPIWGTKGIMHGVAIKRKDGTDSQILDTRYRKKDSKMFGHNGLELGQWFPRRLNMIFQGAHGHSQAGITGDQHTGAYSIVVSGSYDDLDQDHGEKLYYSGSNSHDNTDRNRPAPASAGTQALHRSLETGNPVRVIRTSAGKGRLSPTVGMRYDGLYQVIAVRQPFNSNGGRYEQFELVRLDDQGSLDLLRARPTLKEQRDFDKIQDGFKAQQ